MLRPSLVVLSRVSPLLWCAGFSRRWLLLLWSTGSKGMSLAALQHVESFQIRDQTPLPYSGRQTLIHYTTKEVHILFLTQSEALVLSETSKKKKKIRKILDSDPI